MLHPKPLPPLLLALALWPVPSQAAEPERADAFAGEPRFTQPARVEATGLPVADLLRATGERLGVKLAVRGGLADEKVVVLGPRRPLREILADVAALFNGRWKSERERDGAVRYVLERSPEAQRLEEQLARAARKRVMDRVDAHCRALAESPEELGRRPASDLTRRLLSSPQFRHATETYALLSPRQKDLLFDRGRLNVPFQALTDPQKEGLRRIWAGVLAAEVEFANTAAGMERPGAIRRKPDDVEHGYLRLRAQRMGGNVLVAMYAGGFPVRSEAVVDAEGRPGFATSGWPIYHVREVEGWLPPHGNPYTGEPVRGELPALSEISGAVQERDWLAALRRLSATTGRPLVADYFRMRAVADPAPTEAALGADEASGALDRLCRRSGHLWWTRGRTLLFRKRDWFEQRKYEVPDSWLREVGSAVSRHGGPRFAELRRLLSLTPEQWAGLCSLEREGFVHEPEEIHPARALLHLLLPLDPAGRRLLPSRRAEAPSAGPSLLTYASLSPLQRRQFPLFLQEADGMLGNEVTPGFQAWAYSGPAPDAPTTGGMKLQPLQLRWTLGTDRPSAAIQIPLPAEPPPASPLQIEP